MKGGNSRSGSALIEFAGALVILSAMFTGIFQVGYTFLTYTNLLHAVRSGARFASLRVVKSNTADPEFAKSVANVVVYGDPRPAPPRSPWYGD
jgi:Flp pilus assembly protein TadG